MAFDIERWNGATLVGRISLRGPSYALPTRIKRYQPRARAGGGALYVYTQGPEEKLQTVVLRKLTNEEAEDLQTFIKDILDGSANTCRYWNPETDELMTATLYNAEDVYALVKHNRNEVELVFKI